MEENILSRAETVTDSRAAMVFTNSHLRRLLMQFADQARSLSDVAQRVDMDIRRVHYFAGRLINVGLLEVDRIVPRNGRPIKYYRAIADSFIVPAELLPMSSTQGLANELRALLDGKGGDLLMQLGPSGEPQVRLIDHDDRDDPAFELWRILGLDLSEARNLRADLEAVLRKYQERSRPKVGRTFLIHCAGAVRQGAQGSVDNRAN